MPSERLDRQKRIAPATRRVRELEEQVVELQMDLRTEKARKEIAMTMPEILQDKKNGAEAKTRRRKKRRR